jgi:hypothetical protein
MTPQVGQDEAETGEIKVLEHLIPKRACAGATPAM